MTASRYFSPCWDSSREAVDLLWRSAVKNRMWPHGIVKADPFGNDPFSRKAIAQLVQINRLVFERAPQSFNEDVAQVPAAPGHGDLTPAALSTPVKSKLVNWLP